MSSHFLRGYFTSEFSIDKPLVKANPHLIPLERLARQAIGQAQLEHAINNQAQRVAIFDEDRDKRQAVWESRQPDGSRSALSIIEHHHNILVQTMTGRAGLLPEEPFITTLHSTLLSAEGGNFQISQTGMSPEQHELDSFQVDQIMFIMTTVLAEAGVVLDQATNN